MALDSQRHFAANMAAHESPRTARVLAQLDVVHTEPCRRIVTRCLECQLERGGPRRVRRRHIDAQVGPHMPCFPVRYDEPLLTVDRNPQTACRFPSPTESTPSGMKTLASPSASPRSANPRKVAEETLDRLNFVSSHAFSLAIAPGDR
jgi:hypothetical protein